MIKNLTLSNFKSFSESHSVEIAPLTLIYGNNSSGKSSIIQSILSYASILKGEPSFFSSLPVDLGGFQNVVNRQELNKDIDLGINFDFFNQNDVPIPLLDGVEIVVTINWSRFNGSNLIKMLFNICIDKNDVSLSIDLDQSDNYYIQFDLESWIGASRKLIEVARHINMEFQIKSENSTKLINRFSQYLINEICTISEKELIKYYEPIKANGKMILNRRDRFFSKSAGLAIEDYDLMGNNSLIIFYRLVIREIINRVQSSLKYRYVGPARELSPRLELRETESRREDMSTIARLYSNEHELRQINRFFQRMEIPYELTINVLSNKDIPSAGEYLTPVLVDLRSEARVSLKDVGYGISQLLPVIIETLSTSSKILLIEQPELHLHPRLQVELGQMFVDISQSRNSRKQIIIETHSENLILRIQKLIREKRISHDQVAIIFVGNSENIGSWIQRIEMNTNGTLNAEWPGGFFTERFKELL